MTAKFRMKYDYQIFIRCHKHYYSIIRIKPKDSYQLRVLKVIRINNLFVKNNEFRMLIDWSLLSLWNW
jgi:hypothetical protein